MLRAFYVLIVGISDNLSMPGFSGEAGHIYDIITDYAATVVFLCMVIAIVRRLVFKPARYAVPEKFGKVTRCRRNLPVGIDRCSDGGRQPVRCRQSRRPGHSKVKQLRSWRPVRCRGY